MFSLIDHSDSSGRIVLEQNKFLWYSQISNSATIVKPSQNFLISPKKAEFTELPAGW